MAGARIVRWVVVAGVVLVLVSLMGAASIAAGFDALREKASAVAEPKRGSQGAAQISYDEFRFAPVGMTTAKLRARVGEPEAKGSHEVEGLELECWLYGIAGGSGAYQFCFANDRLRAKFVFAG